MIGPRVEMLHNPALPMVLPKPNRDFYRVFQQPSEAVQQTVSKARAFMETSVAPIINDFWAKDSFPFDEKKVGIGMMQGLRDFGSFRKDLAGLRSFTAEAYVVRRIDESLRRLAAEAPSPESDWSEE